MRKGLTLVLAVLLGFGLSTFAMAQGSSTVVLSGTVRSADGLALPGVTVNLKSAALQGVRSTTSDAAGAYLFKGLPPADYTVSFQLTGMATIEQNVTIELGNSVRVDATMQIATVQETVVVTGEAPSALNTPQVVTNYTKTEIDRLPMARNPMAMALLSPNLSDNTPNAGTLTIGGAMATDNVILLDGVDIQDNLFSNQTGVFIEDAIESQSVLTGAISAEYGRFLGGVVNAVTKRGGNTFGGTFRTELSSPDWRDENPIETRNNVTRTHNVSKTFSATVGGPLMRDRVWFFAAGRHAPVKNDTTLAQTNLPYTQTIDDDRFEGKLTGSLNPNHTFSAAYTHNKTEQFQPAITNNIDPAGLITRQLPAHLFVANYNGILRANLFAEAQYSEKKFGFRNAGGTSTLMVDSPIQTLGIRSPAGFFYNAPYFDATDPEDRNNRQLTGALSYFLSTTSFGRHDIKVGGEHFTTRRTGGNSQSATSYRINTDYLTNASGQPVLDSNGRLIPVFTPNVTTGNNFVASRGGILDIRTVSMYVNDKWTLNDHWSFNLGARFEVVRSDATGGIVGIDTNNLVPRVSAGYDVKGNGKYVLYAGYAEYSGKYNEARVGSNTSVGNPDNFQLRYVGPAGQGRGFAPGFDPANYVVINGAFPTANVFFEDNVHSPVNREFSFSAGAALGRNGFAKATFTQRKIGSFIEDFVNPGTGKTTIIKNGINFGVFDNILYANSDLPDREYQAVSFEGRYRVANNWNTSVFYTLQLKNEGNFEGEGTNTPYNASIIGDRPELYTQDRHYPIGNLDDFQRHRLIVTSAYRVNMGHLGGLDLGVLYRYNSPTTYSLAATFTGFTAAQTARAVAAGYARVPANQTIFFAPRGSEFFEDVHLLNAALTYDIPLWKTFKPWIKGELRNVFNNQKLTSWNTTVTAVTAGPVDALGLPTTYNKSATFGTGTANANYPIPREFFISAGFRF